MISCNEGIVRVEGSTNTLLADVTVIIHALYSEFQEHIGKDNSKEALTHAVNLALDDYRDIEPEKVINHDKNEEVKGITHTLDRIEALLGFLVKELDDGK